MQMLQFITQIGNGLWFASQESMLWKCGPHSDDVDTDPLGSPRSLRDSGIPPGPWLMTHRELL